MPFMAEKDGKGYYKRHGHCAEGPVDPRSVMVGKEARFWDAVDGDRNYDRDESDY